MAEGIGIETYANHANAVSATTGTAAAARDGVVKRALFFVGVAALSAGIAYGVVRATIARRPPDPTTERIQQLIDEANRLLAQLDEKKSAS